METKATPKMSLKLLINKKHNKVVFAEAKSDFIDFLFDLLTLPIGIIVSFLPNENCLRDLHEGINKLEEAYLLPNQSEDSPLKLNTLACAILPFFCPSSSRSCRYVQNGLVTYMVADDLSIAPLSITSTMALFEKFNIREVGALEEKVVAIGLEEALRLLKGALQSKEALTKAFLKKEETKASVKHDYQPLIKELPSLQMECPPSAIISHPICCQPSTIEPPSHKRSASQPPSHKKSASDPIDCQPPIIDSHQIDCQPSTIELPSHKKSATKMVTIHVKPKSHVGHHVKPTSC